MAIPARRDDAHPCVPPNRSQAVHLPKQVAFPEGVRLLTVLREGKRRVSSGRTPSGPLPHAPAYVLGMINLRGAVLPVLDLSSRLGLPPRSPDVSSVVVVAELGDRPVGLLVDAVCDIITVDRAQIQAPPELGRDCAADRSGASITLGDEIVTLLNLENALPEAGLAA